MSITSMPATTVERTATMDTPIGELAIVARAGVICEIRLPDAATELPTAQACGDLAQKGDLAPRATADSPGPGDVLDEARAQLADYFAGRRREFELPFCLQGTAFQRRVWQALLGVGYGETVSYAELARAVGCPGAARAVGAAVGRNRLPIVVPCHRVIGARGDLRGFASGLARKRYLLDAETRRLRA
jgi:methylated-DNA-[protein]-cysteine S-methyltransferase